MTLWNETISRRRFWMTGRPVVEPPPPALPAMSVMTFRPRHSSQNHSDGRTLILLDAVRQRHAEEFPRVRACLPRWGSRQVGRDEAEETRRACLRIAGVEGPTGHDGAPVEEEFGGR